MNISFVNVTSPQSGTGNNVAVSVPSGTLDSHFLVDFCESDNTSAGSFTDNLSAWTTLFSVDQPIDSGRVTALYKRAKSEPTSYTFTSSSAIGVISSMVAYSGVDLVNPFDAPFQGGYNTVAAVSNTITLTAPPITSQTDNCLLLWLACVDVTNTTAVTNINVPPGYTSRAASQDTSGWNVIAIGEKQLGVAGPQPAASAVWSQGVSGNVGVTALHILLRPAVSPNPTQLSVPLVRAPGKSGMQWGLNSAEWW